MAGGIVFDHEIPIIYLPTSRYIDYGGLEALTILTHEAIHLVEHELYPNNVFNVRQHSRHFREIARKTGMSMPDGLFFENPNLVHWAARVMKQLGPFPWEI